MQFFLISDNVDTQVGMRLTGIPGVVVHEAGEVKQALEKAAEDKDIAIILITEKLVKLCENTVYDFKLNRKSPLVVEVPDRHAETEVTASISRYVRESIGLKI